MPGRAGRRLTPKWVQVLLCVCLQLEKMEFCFCTSGSGCCRSRSVGGRMLHLAGSDDGWRWRGGEGRPDGVFVKMIQRCEG